MQERVYKAFKREYLYRCPSELERDIEIVKNLMDEIPKPQTLGPVWPDFIAFDTEGNGKHLGNDLISWLAFEWHGSETFRIRDRLLEIAIEDSDSAKERNKDYTNVYHRKITLIKKAQTAAIERLKSIVDEMEAMLSSWMKEEAGRSLQR